MSEIRVDLGQRSYDIHIGEGLIDRAGALIASACRGKRACIVTNRIIGNIYGARLVRGLEGAGIFAEIITVPAGERYKTLRTVAGIYEKLVDQRIDRTGMVIGLGGGVAGDMAGFAAATFLRGVDFVQIPTSLLAQVDASIGGKTGVDLSRGKNLVGAFYQPRTVIIDTTTLRTLPRREFRAGLAEVIKHGIIRDEEYFAYIDENLSSIMRLDSDALEHTILRSCEIKAEVVHADEREAGLRRILNFGHTAGHAVESLTGYRAYLHGEAIAIGMVTAACVSVEVGSANSEIVSRIVGILIKAGLPYKLPEGLPPAEVVAAMKLDKKVAHGKLHSVLVNKIGEAFVAEDVTPEIWLRALEIQARLRF
jgi:3-dehydroquinate synthase